MSLEKEEREALAALLDAARTYDVESQGGEHPLIAGARLRLAAKRWAPLDRALGRTIANVPRVFAATADERTRT